MHEFDRFVRHQLCPAAYLRYGDDFVLFHPSLATVKQMQAQATEFLTKKLHLTLNPKSNVIFPVEYGIRFLGAVITPQNLSLSRRNRRRVRRLNSQNASSYLGLAAQFEPILSRELAWRIISHV